MAVEGAERSNPPSRPERSADEAADAQTQVHELPRETVALIDATLAELRSSAPRMAVVGGPAAALPAALARLVSEGDRTGQGSVDDPPSAGSLPADPPDVLLICRPDDNAELLGPDLTTLERTCAAVVAGAIPGQTLILTSASYVGSARDLLVVPLAARGLIAGREVHVAVSPEPITGTSAGDGLIVGGATETCGLKAASILEAAGPVTRKLTLEDAEAAALTAHAPTGLGALAKRLIDVVGAAIGLVVLAPAMAVVAAVIKLDSHGPVLFTQERVGRHGRRFRFRKFRTMADGAENRLHEVLHLNGIKGPAFQIERDPRLTRVGRFLRKSSLDELPELWNVLRGEMSLVGPRPAPVVEVASYKPWHLRRLAMKPGLTGLAQVRARKYREFDVKAGLDLQYIDHWSLWLDVRILLDTVPAVLRFTGR